MAKAERDIIRQRFRNQGLKLTKQEGRSRFPLKARPKGSEITIKMFSRWSEAAIWIDGFEWGRTAQ